MTKIIAIANQKGGSGKTTTTLNLGGALVRAGNRVLLIDFDPQASLTVCMGLRTPDELEITIKNALENFIDDTETDLNTLIRTNEEGIDFIPANIDLAAFEMTIINEMSRERILHNFIKAQIANIYDYILIDCAPSLSMLTINALTCVDEVLVPVQAEFLAIKGLQQLMHTIARTKKCLNPSLEIKGILITMVDNRTINSKYLIDQLRRQKVLGPVFETVIPRAVSATESTASGKSIFNYDPAGKVAQAYLDLCGEVTRGE